MPALSKAGSIDLSLRQCSARADSRGCLRISRSTRRGKPSFESESACAEMMMPVNGCARQGRVKRPGLEPVQCPRRFARMPVHACSLQGRINRPELEAVQCPRGLQRMPAHLSPNMAPAYYSIWSSPGTPCPCQLYGLALSFGLWFLLWVSTAAAPSLSPLPFGISLKWVTPPYMEVHSNRGN